MIHDPTFIEKRYEETPIKYLRNSAGNNYNHKNKMNSLRPKQKHSEGENNFFNNFKNNFLGRIYFLNNLKFNKLNYKNKFIKFRNN